jgi:hypothetical protein
MAVKIQLRRDTAANWTAADTVLALGEPGVETDTLKLKVGDGITAWTSLAYSISYNFNDLNSKPTTLAGYGITDALTLTSLSVGAEATAAGDGAIAYDNTTGAFTYTPPDTSTFLTSVAYADLTTTPTTLSGYGITDAVASSAISTFGGTLVDDADATAARTTLGLGSAATTDATDYATSAQGLLADSALQSGAAISVGNITTTGYLRGPATFTIDPAAHGDNTGKVVIAGDLQVDGTQTTINSTTLDIDDINITLASGAAGSSAANGAGITVDGASATITYVHATTSWDLNKPVNVTGNFNADGDLFNLGSGSKGRLQIKGGSSEDSQIRFFDGATARARIGVQSGTAALVLSGSDTMTPDVSIDPSGNVTMVGTLDVDGAEITVGTTGSRFAENNLRFNAAGDSYVDVNTVGAELKVRTSAVSALDNTIVSFTDAGTVFSVDAKFEEGIKSNYNDNLEIYTTASDSFITEAGTAGSLFLQTNNEISLRSTLAEYGLTFNVNGSLDIFYDNAKKLETTAKGVEVTGDVALGAIDTDITTTESAMFLYDTRLDSDGGAWRRRVQGTSWYNEALNTSTRGSRKDFPAVALIVADNTADTVTIYDADHPDMAMWMVFNINNTQWMKHTNGGTNVVDIFAMNGQMYTCGGTAGGRFGIMDFIRDSGDMIEAGYHYTAEGIVRRNLETIDSHGAVGVLRIATLNAICVTATVLPDTPIDPLTGIHQPTIYVGTAEGLTVLNADRETYYEGTSVTGTAYSYVGHITITPNGDLWYAGDSFDTYLSFRDTYVVDPKLITRDWTWNNATDDQTILPSYAISTSNENGDVKVGHVNNSAFNFLAGPAAGTRLDGLVLFDFNDTDAQPQLHAHIQTDHNTGWQTKDTRLVVMSDNDDTDVVGSGELISNGDFSGGTTNWTTNGTSIITDQGGYIRVDRNSGSVANQCYQDITTVVGETYMIRAKVLATNNQYASIYHPGGETKSTTPATADILTGSFVATGTTSRIELAATGGTSITADFDDVSCMLAVDDRSAKFQSIPVYGTIPKQVCDTGTDLVSYGPFSTSNYIEAPYNDELNFGTGDFSFSGWFNMTSTTSQGLISRVADGLGGTQAGFAMNTASSGVLGWAMYTTGLHSPGRTNCGFGFTPKTNVWNHVVAMRKSGVMYLYLNGQLDTSLTPANTDDITDTTNSPPLSIGLLANAGSPANATKLALWRISSTVPTEEQILKMFNDEKLMFEINAKATLYWDTTSTNRQRISGLAYDPITKRIHAGTSSGRSEFQGLIRVNNSTDAVGTNITSVDGLVAEG